MNVIVVAVPNAIPLPVLFVTVGGVVGAGDGLAPENVIWWLPA